MGGSKNTFVGNKGEKSLNCHFINATANTLLMKLSAYYFYFQEPSNFVNFSYVK